MTQVYAEVIGDPIAHSKSPLIHRFWLDVLGIDADYRAVRVEPPGLADYFEARRSDPAWRGANITLPHKVAALEFVDDRGGVHDTIGAINTAFRDADGTVIGTNTDAAGFFAPIHDLDLKGRWVGVVGTGGAARAVLFALARMQVGRVSILARNEDRALSLLHRFGLRGDVLPVAARLPPLALLVNASSLGMTGQPAYAPALDDLPETAIVYDLVYAPLETPLLAAARARNLDTVDGLEMLIAQAAVAFELFFGAAPPRDRDEDLRALLTA